METIVAVGFAIGPSLGGFLYTVSMREYIPHARA